MIGAEKLVARFARVATAAISDAQASFGAISGAIRTVVPGARVAGPACTVQCYPGSIITVHRALVEARPGEVLVVDGGGDPHGALLGELMAQECMARGIAGAIIDGAVRDVAGIRRLGFPVWAAWRTPRVATNRRVGRVNVPVACGGVPVHPGDWVVGDDDGVVVIPHERVEEVLAAAEAVEEKEAGISRRIDAGERLADILHFRELVGPERT